MFLIPCLFPNGKGKACLIAVQLGPQGDGLEKGRHDEMEHGIGEVRLRLVLFGKVGVDGRQVDALGDIRLVIAEVGVDDDGDEVQGVQLPQQPAILTVAWAMVYVPDIEDFDFIN